MKKLNVEERKYDEILEIYVCIDEHSI